MYFLLLIADDSTKLHAEHRKIVADDGTCGAVSEQPENESCSNKENEPPTKKAKKPRKKCSVEKCEKWLKN